MSSSKSRKAERELKEMSISLDKFLILYCGVPESAVLGKKISHRNIKHLIPDLHRISNDILMKDKRDLYTGDIIMVIDSYGHISPYITPDINLVEQSFEFEKYDITKKEEKLENIILNENLSRYELVLLIRYFKKHGRVKEYRVARKLLKMKKDTNNVKIYRKEKLRKRGIEDYEEF